MDTPPTSVRSTTYTIQCPARATFVTGRTKDQEQVILGVPGTFAVLAAFRETGELRRYEAIQVLPCGMESTKLARQLSGAELDTLWKAVADKQAEIGYRPGPVSVCRFFHTEWGLGITDCPAALVEALNDPVRKADVLAHEECHRVIEAWRKSGQFVLHWGAEHSMNLLGEITGA